MTIMPKNDRRKQKTPSKITDTFKKQKSSRNRVYKPQTRQQDHAIPSTSASTDTTTLIEKDMSVLREFDLNWQYGPCLGITRLERWERAKKNGLDPPENILELIEKNLNNDIYTLCIWGDNKQL